MRAAIIVSLFLFITLLGMLLYRPEPEPVPVGVLHSLSGTMAASEKPVVDATLLAIEQINAAGGVLGHQLKPVVADGASDPQQFAELADKLIEGDGVRVIFGCWTSASRKRVMEVVEQHRHLLIYPVQYEGLEAPGHVVYTGATPNQQVTPAITWIMRHLGKRLYLVGSDYVYPRVANWLIRRQVDILGGDIIGESYIHLGSSDVQAVMDDLQRLQPDVVINTINGSSLKAFFSAYRQHWTASSLPVMSFSLGESEIQSMGLQAAMNGNYVSWSYVQSLENRANQQFVRAFRQRYGKERVVSDPMEAAWLGVRLWADAVTSARSFDPESVLAAIRHRSIRAPEGIVSIDHETLHSWRMARIARAHADGQFEVVWQSDSAVQPVPFPLIIEKGQASAFLKSLYAGWHEHWQAP